MPEDHPKPNKPHTKPPELEKKILSCLLFEEDREAILGDFEEEFQHVANCKGVDKARVWYLLETLKSAPSLIYMFHDRLLRYVMAAIRLSPRTENRLAVAGLVLTLPALMLFCTGMLQSGFGITQPNDTLDAIFRDPSWSAMRLIIHPATLVGGLFLALGLNLLPVMRLKVHMEEGSLVSTMRVRGRLLNLTLVALCIFLIASLFLYAFVENFQIVPR